MDASASRPHTAATSRLARAILAAGIVAALAIFAAAYLSNRVQLVPILDDVHWTISFLLATVLAWMGVRDAPAEEAKVRRCFAVGLSSNAVGQVIWELADYLGWEPFPAPSDYLFVSMGLCFSAGMFSILRSLPAVSKSLALDVSSLALVVLTLTLDLYLPQQSTLRPVEFALLIAYPIALLLPGCVGIVLAPTLRWRFDHRWALFVASSLANGAIWMEWNHLTALDRFESGTWLNLSFSLITLLMGYGAYSWRPQVNLERAWERRCEQVLRLIPLGVVAAAVISVAIVLTLPGVLESVQLATFIGAALVIGLAVARQNLSLLERDRMAEAELRAHTSESRLGLMFAAIRDGVSVIDARGQLITVNPACEALFGYERGELHGKAMALIDGSPEQPSLLEHFAREQADGGALFEAQFRMKDGSAIDVEVSATRAPEGGIVATFRDITERKRSRAQLDALVKRLSVATSAANMGIWEVDLATGRATWDRRMFELHGVARPDGEPDWKQWWSQVYPEDVAGLREFWQRPPAHCDYAKRTYRYVLPSGEIRHIQTHALWQRQNGELRHVTGVQIDITELKRTEEQLRTALLDLSLATDAAQLGVATLYVQENRVVCDARTFELYGVEPIPGPVPREYFRRHVHPDDLAAIGKGMNEGTLTTSDFGHEYRVVLPNGQIRWIELRASILLEHGTPTRITGVHWDITARKNAEADRLRLEAQLQQAQKLEALGTLAGGIAHDFNNILGAILGNAELAREDLDGAHAVQRSLEEIRKASLRGKDLVQRLLAFGRPQDQRRERLNLQSVVQDAVMLLRPAIPATVELALNVTEPTLPVLVDAVQVSQVIVNLGMNAYQAIPDHKGRIELSVSTKHVQTHEGELRAGQYVCLSVQDDGMGMTEDTLERAFEPFFTTKSLGQGTGLGLAVVHGIVRAHGGVITIDSAPGRGTRVDVYFPALQSEPIEELPEERPEPVLAQERGQHILYLDDEESLVFLARRLLERMGYRMSGFTEPHEALNAFRTSPTEYDLVITDLSMPGTSGMEVAKEILRIHPEALVVLASGYLRSQDIDEARAIGIREVILKPNTVEELTSVVHMLLSQVGVRG